LVLTDIHNENLTRRKREESTLALKILVLASLATISTFHVHHQNIIRHPRAIGCCGLGLHLVL
jgi:hypothetical protein